MILVWLGKILSSRNINQHRLAFLLMSSVSSLSPRPTVGSVNPLALDLISSMLVFLPEDRYVPANSRAVSYCCSLKRQLLNFLTIKTVLVFVCVCVCLCVGYLWRRR